jgi:hypothetical protein
MMLQTIFIGLWVVIFALLCIGVRRALRQRAHECRQAQRQTMRRFTGEHFGRRRNRRRSVAYQAVAG